MKVKVKILKPPFLCSACWPVAFLTLGAIGPPESETNDYYEYFTDQCLQRRRRQRPRRKNATHARQSTRMMSLVHPSVTSAALMSIRRTAAGLASFGAATNVLLTGHCHSPKNRRTLGSCAARATRRASKSLAGTLEGATSRSSNNTKMRLQAEAPAQPSARPLASFLQLSRLLRRWAK